MMDEQKVYLLFSGESYYPEGGARDFKATSSNLDELKEMKTEDKDAWWHIVEAGDIGTILWQRSCDWGGVLHAWRETKQHYGP